MTTQNETLDERGSMDAPSSLSSGARSGFKVALVFLVTLLLASSWLVVPYILEGRQLLQDASNEVVSERNAAHRTLGMMLSRYLDGPGNVDVDATYATDVYFEQTSSPRVAAQYEPDQYHIFFVNEGVHVGQLPERLVDATLEVDGVTYEAADVEGPLLTDHHRNTTVRFDRFDENGDPIVTPETERVTLTVANGWDADDTPRSTFWELPIDYPDSDSVLTSPALIMALAAGLLSATLTPCLIQLIVVFMATMTGMSAEQISRTDSIPSEVRRRMFLIAVAFVVGIVAFYTAAGAVIGYAGKSAQILFDAYSREMAVATGILVILMGLWMGIKARAPVVCHMPAPAMLRTGDKGGYIRSALMAAGFSLGCMVCFSGAIMGTMFVYVGSIGSAPIGALILFVFSLGVAIPFLAAAFFLSRTISVMQWASKYSPQIGFVSMLVIIAFGIVLVTDNFHTVSDIIYPWLMLD